MKKFNLPFLFIVCAVMLLSGCERNAISVTFGDGTAAGSTDHVIMVGYQEEKDYEKLGTDVFVKSNVDNLKITIQKELYDKIEVTLPEKDTYYSLTKLFANAKSKQPIYTVYKEALNINLIINSDQDAILTFKAIVGELQEGNTLLLKTKIVSQEYQQKVKKDEK